MEVSESVAPPFDVENVRFVQQAIEDGRGKGFIVGEINRVRVIDSRHSEIKGSDSL